MLTAEIVQQVKQLQLRTGKDVADVLAGAYLSVFKGRGMEFEEVRPYVPGDDVRTIDWNVTARMGEPYVKRYVEERELTVMLLVDISPSQNFGSARRSKREASAELSALLAFSAISNDDKVGLLLFHGAAEEYIPPRKGQKHALRVIREVLARGREEGGTGRRAAGSGPAESSADSGSTRRSPLDLPRWVWRRFRRLVDKTRSAPSRATSIAHALEFCQRVLPRRAVLFLISDFLDEGYLDVLRSAGRRHDIVAVLVTDEREMELSGAGLIALEDAETGQTRLVDTRSQSFRERVATMAGERVAALQTDLRASRIDMIRIDATRSVIDPLLQFFRMRERRLRR